MIKKNVLIGVFIEKEEKNEFLKKLSVIYGYDESSVYIFEVDGNDSEYLVTFKANDNKDMLKSVNNSVILHIKNGCLFSINALNKLIVKENGSADKNYQVDWEKYRNTLIILEGGNLKIVSTKKILSQNGGK